MTPASGYCGPIPGYRTCRTILSTPNRGDSFMVRYRVRGGNALRGTAFVQGAKNAVLPMIGAALLAAEGRTVLRNVPLIEDVRRAIELAEAVGARVQFHEEERTLVIDASGCTPRCCPRRSRRGSAA